MAVRRRRRRTAERETLSTTVALTAELTGGLAHDLNNRLSVILGQAQLLRRSCAADPMIARRLEKIEEETLRASRMTRGLVELSRREDPPHGILSMNKIVPCALGAVRAKLRDRGITLETDLTSRLGLIRGDADQLTQVLLHLADNAIDAMGEGGTLSITTALTDDRLEILIGDTGAGMDAEEVSRIFEPFYTTKPEAIGLGLFLTLAILKTHGGTIAVETAPGRGTTMRVRLPRPLAPVAAPQPI